ncbi:hypothetical protein [Bradyrhizobium sp. WSM1743]|uniref:ATP-dependent DNA ligase n=1 Tax=Bradyrhizobium sp. WSM1743 TaxID=318996 RepID=UPI000685037D|nr:hypothetical protein [Bradyrhizobium sp. WSM1743]
MPSTFEFYLPSSGPDRFHEITYDGYRLRAERNGRTERLITRNGRNWTDRFAWIVQAAQRNREQEFDIDGEAVRARRRRCLRLQHAALAPARR